MTSPVYRFTCGHAGRTAERDAGFIRVSSIRNAPVIVSHFPCPECKTAGRGAAVDHDPGLTERSVRT